MTDASSLDQKKQKLGIKMCQPYFQIEEFCIRENVAVFSSNYELYANLSGRMMSTIASQVDCIDPYSIDECFANMSGYEGLGTDLTQLGFRIKEKYLGMSASQRASVSHRQKL